jgi:hypothetical protein
MQVEKRLQNHYRRWNIGLNYEEEFLQFKNRLIEVLDWVIGKYLVKNSNIDERLLKIYRLHKGEEPNVKKSLPTNLTNQINSMKECFSDTEKRQFTDKGFGDTNLYELISNCKTSQELASVLQFLFWVLEESQEETIKSLSKQLVQEIRKISILTPSASFQIYKKGKQIIIYPHGDDFLDKGIIDHVLSGLEDYPEVVKHFEGALKIYQSGETNQYRNLLDNLRFAFEQLLKKILKNQKSLENQKENLLRWLREKGLYIDVVNLYEKLFSTYLNYQNNAVKHNEEFSLNEVEFMIYLTGNFIRLIIQLAREEKCC